MDEDKPIPSEKNIIKVVEIPDMSKMIDEEIRVYAKALWGKITTDHWQE